MMAGALSVLALRVTLLLVGAFATARLLSARSAGARHMLWACAFGCTLALPLTSAIAPRMPGPSVNELIAATRARYLRVNGRAVGPRTPTAGAIRGSERAPAGVLDLDRLLAGNDRSRGVPLSTTLVFLWVAGIIVVGSRLARDVAPASAGILRPSIVLPAAAVEWSDAQLRAVLLHELSHVRRRDCLTQLLAKVACTLHWYNPLIWLAERRLSLERERACDDRVLTAAVAPIAYAGALVEMARESLAARAAPAALLAMARPSELETRVVAVLNPRCSRADVTTRFAIAVGVLSAAMTIGVGAVRLDAAPARVEPPARSVATQLPGDARLEPDRRGDSVASPLSERLPGVRGSSGHPIDEATLRGPDSLLARLMLAGVDRIPSWQGDLVAERARWALAQARDGRLVEPLTHALGDADWRVSAYAAWALAYSRDTTAVPQLVPLLRHPVWRLRAMAAYALAELGDRRALPAMAEALDDEAWQVRVSAVGFIGRVGDARRRALLRSRLTDRHIAVRGAAAEALSQYPPDDAR
ncbi:MAG: M56 family metallopeptidase [Gemmatimonadaceae bacterium]